MSRDHLMPAGLGQTNPKTGTPVRLTLIIGTVVALDRLADADRQARGDGQHRHAVGVHAGLARRPDPAQAPPRPQAVVQGAVATRWLPWLSAAVCFYLMLNLSVETWLRFLDLDGARLPDLLRLLAPATASWRRARRKRGRRAPRRSSANADLAPSSPQPARDIHGRAVGCARLHASLGRPTGLARVKLTLAGALEQARAFEAIVEARALRLGLGARRASATATPLPVGRPRRSLATR